MTTKRDQKRYETLIGYGCCVCKLSDCHTTPEMHHIVDKGYRKHSGGNQATIPLCPWHHRGVTHGGFNKREMTTLYGPSLADGSKPFHERWGTQRELLKKVNEAIK